MVKIIAAICNGHSPTDTSVAAMAASQSQRLYSGVGIFHWHHLNAPPPQILRTPGIDLGRTGLISFGFRSPQLAVRAVL